MKKHLNSPKTFYTIISTILLGLFLFVILTSTQISIYFSWLLANSLVIFFLYGYDKFMAIQQNRRVPEIVFHLFSLAGGFLGGFIGMTIFRHKKNKNVFYLFLILGTALHLYIIRLYYYDYIFELVNNIHLN